MKRLSTAALALAVATVLTAAFVAPVQAKTAKAVHPMRMSLRYAPVDPGARGPRPGHLSTLVGDRESGLGFYPLPRQYRIAALHARETRGDAIRYAVATEAGNGYYYGIGGDAGYGDRHHHSVFNPVDGYGTPFFAGYYGPAGDPDAERGPFGNPYN